MNTVKEHVLSLQKSLKSLKLQPSGDEGIFKDRNVLLGKVLSSRNFRLFTITEIITKTRNLSSRVQIEEIRDNVFKFEKISDNVFKFTFDNREDMNYIFTNRPWFLNGAHLILKEWPAERMLSEISFETSTFFFQVHGLPPGFLHNEMAKMVANKVGVMLHSPIGKRCVIANRYLRF